MPTHSILAWEIPGTEEPSRLRNENFSKYIHRENLSCYTQTPNHKSICESGRQEEGCGLGVKIFN